MKVSDNDRVFDQAFADCGADDGFQWCVDRFDDTKILRYKVEGFEKLPLNEKLLVYYLGEAAKCGRDILFDQNFRYNLAVRRVLETVYREYSGDRGCRDWTMFEEYLKKVWFANGVHHHYSCDKFIPKFSEGYLDHLLDGVSKDKLPKDFGRVDELIACVKRVLFDPTAFAKRINQAENEDMILTSANNYYRGVSQGEVECFYGEMIDPNDQTPISYGLNSQLVKDGETLAERVWRVGGMYSDAIEQIVYWLDKARVVAGGTQQSLIDMLISFYNSGNLEIYDQFNISWVKDVDSMVDFVNGFTEVYGDPMGYKASWESTVNIKDLEATKRTSIISENAQWFEDNSPIDSQFKKSSVTGVSAKVVTVVMLGGDCYPSTPIGINLPNADWIRRDHGSKSVTIENITTAYSEAAKGGGFLEEFVLRKEDRERIEQFGALADNLHIDLHECLGHGSGRLALGVKGDELKQYGSALEETRADLFALYYLADPKLIELGVVPSGELYKAEYSRYIMNGMMTQLTRVVLGKSVEQAHMRNRKLIAEWCYERGRDEKIIEMITVNGKRYVVVNDFESARMLFGELLREIQRIKSEGDFCAGRDLIEKYAVDVDYELHAEVLERYNALNLEPYSGFVNPTYIPILQDGKIVDVKVSYDTNYVDQMLEYSERYSFLPTLN